MKWLACFLPIFRWMVDSSGFIPASKKIVVFSQLAEVVLLVIDKAQSPGLRHFDIVSIQGVMMEAINSRRLLDARKR
jgi:hypothetical protein